MNQTEKDALLRAIAHLESMKERAVVSNSIGRPICVYHGESGQKCAVGVLITDEAYDEKMEGSALSYSPLVEEVLAKSLDLSELSLSFIDALSDLQSIHDDEANWDEDGFRPLSRAAVRLARVKDLANA